MPMPQACNSLLACSSAMAYASVSVTARMGMASRAVVIMLLGVVFIVLPPFCELVGSDYVCYSGVGCLSRYLDAIASMLRLAWRCQLVGAPVASRRNLLRTSVGLSQLRVSLGRSLSSSASASSSAWV